MIPQILWNPGHHLVMPFARPFGDALRSSLHPDHFAHRCVCRAQCGKAIAATAQHFGARGRCNESPIGTSSQLWMFMDLFAGKLINAFDGKKDPLFGARKGS